MLRLTPANAGWPADGGDLRGHGHPGRSRRAGPDAREPGPADRARRQDLYDAATALRLGQEEWAKNKALCGYCQTATLASLASVALALPEAIEALRHLQGGRDARPA
jgi:hypothetical protein